MRFAMSALFTALILNGNAFAKDDSVNRGPKPAWVNSSEPLPVPDEAKGLAFVRYQDIFIHVDQRGQHIYSGFRIKLLHPNALQLGNLSLSWNPSSGETTVHSIKVYRGGTMIDVLPMTQFEILRREGQLEAAMLTGSLTAVATVPDLRVDDELEFAFTTRQRDPTLGNNDAGFLFLSPETAPGRYALQLSWAEGHRPNVKISTDIDPISTRSNQAIKLQLDNPSKLNLAKDAPPRFSWQRVIEYSDFADWLAVSRHFSPFFEQASTLKPNSLIKAEAERIAATHADPLDRAHAALKLVQRDVRYIYVGLDGGNFRPATADETWQRRYGDCKGKTALLLALLKELGIEAEAVLANNGGNDDGLEQRLPSPNAFDHVLVRARIAGKSYFMDGTMPPVVRPAAQPVLPYRWLLPLRTVGAALEKLEWQPATVPEEINLFEIDARKGFDQPALITSTTIIRGLAGLQQQVGFSSLTAEQLQEGLRQQLVGDTWQTIDSAKWHYDERAQASILTIVGTGTVDWKDGRRGSKSLSLPGGGFNPPEKRIRAAGQDQSLPFFTKGEFSCHVTTVRLPADTEPEQWSYNDGFDTRIFGRNYYRAFDFKEHSIRMIRGSRVEAQEIDAAKAAQDNGQIATFDNSMAWIYYDIDGPTAPEPSKQLVPATYDFDWTADNVPCLAAGSLK